MKITCYLYEMILLLLIGVVFACSPNGKGVSFKGRHPFDEQAFLNDKLVQRLITKYFPNWFGTYQTLQKLRGYAKPPDSDAPPAVKKPVDDDNDDSTISNFVDKDEDKQQEQTDFQSNETIKKMYEKLKEAPIAGENNDNITREDGKKKRKRSRMRQRKNRKIKKRQEREKKARKEKERKKKERVLNEETKKEEAKEIGSNSQTVGDIIKIHERKNGRKITDIRNLFRPIF